MPGSPTRLRTKLTLDVGEGLQDLLSACHPTSGHRAWPGPTKPHLRGPEPRPSRPRPLLVRPAQRPQGRWPGGLSDWRPFPGSKIMERL